MPIFVDIYEEVLLLLEIVILGCALFVLTHAFFVQLIFIVMAYLSVKVANHLKVVVHVFVLLLLFLIPALCLFDNLLIFDYLPLKGILIALFALLQLSYVLLL